MVFSNVTFFASCSFCFYKSDKHPISPNPWVKHLGQKNDGNDCQLKMLLIAKQILLVSTLENVGRTVWRICILILGFEGLRLSYHGGFQSREAAFPRNFETSLNVVNFDSYQWKEKSHWENSLTNPTKKDNKNLFFFFIFHYLTEHIIVADWEIFFEHVNVLTPFYVNILTSSSNCFICLRSVPRQVRLLWSNFRDDKLTRFPNETGREDSLLWLMEQKI